MFGKSSTGAQPSSSAAPSTPTSPPSAQSSALRRSVLHDGITITGDWESDGVVEFGGTIKGDLTADTLVLTSSGIVNGNIRARDVTIMGTLEGTIAALSVKLTHEARVKADIETEHISIAPGAKIEGHLKSQPQKTKP